MAYNLQSLITILQQILNPNQNRWFLGKSKPKLQSLLQRAASLQKILEHSPLTKKEHLEIQIRDVAYRAEDIIESHLVDRMLSMPEGVRFTLLAPDVEQVMHELDSSMEQVMQELDSSMEQVAKLGEGNKMWSGSSSSGTSFSSSKSVVVGVDEDLMQLKDRLTGSERKLEIIPIVGMGGIGKTTLARNLYQDQLIVEHFEFLAWATISQEYNMKAILSSLLRCMIGKEFDAEHIGKENHELKDLLYKSLYGIRFMIVLDDIWSTKFWDEIRRYLPDNNNGSRILITTRESDVAKYADSRSLGHKVQLLNKSKSWDLLRQIVFGEEDCHDDVLQGIGKKIASDCGGLPLAINVIGGLLSKVERSQDIWENIGKDVRAAIAESDEECSNILSLSYNHLSNHLKPCFLYMGGFPEDYEINGSRLIEMWVAEGIVKSNGSKSLEEEAEDYLKALVERNLVFVKKLKFNGKPKSLSMHDLLRDLCITIGIKDTFLEVNHAHNVFTISSNPRRVCFHESYDHPHRVYDDLTEMMPHVRTFVSFSTEILSPVFFAAFRLLRVLDVRAMLFKEFPTQVLQLVNLRYLAFNCDSSSTLRGISRLCNLQTLISKSLWVQGDMPCEIWEMSELRHIKLDVFFEKEDDMKKHVLKKVQTLSDVVIYESPIWKDFFQSFPNIKKLGLYFHGESRGVIDLSHLRKLEKVGCRFGLLAVVSRIRFPSTLKSLHLCFGTISSRDLSTLCDLPNLEELTIKCRFEDEVWELAEDDEFSSLRFLQLSFCNYLVHWRADETNFPTLRHLFITCCYNLEEIPSGIGEIPTLQLIKMYGCCATAVASAKQIQEVQQSDYGNYDLQLRLSSL